MAKLTVDGLDGIMVDMIRQDATLRTRIDNAMTLGADILQKQMQEETKRFIAPTGELARLTRPGMIFHFPDAVKISVWPQGMYTGRRGDPRRAAEVGFVMENGVKPYFMTKGKYANTTRSSQKANPWMSRAMRKKKWDIANTMKDAIYGG